MTSRIIFLPNVKKSVFPDNFKYKCDGKAQQRIGLSEKEGE